MEEPEILYRVPVILRILCYACASSLFLSSVFWLARLGWGRSNLYSMKFTAGLWLVRTVLLLSLISLLAMAISGTFLTHILVLFPEFAILCLIAAFYVLAHKTGGLRPPKGTSRFLIYELLSVLGVLSVVLATWIISLALGTGIHVLNQALNGPVWLPGFIVAVSWIVLIIMFFQRAAKRWPDEGLNVSQILWTLVAVCLLFMLPDIIENIINSPKLLKMQNATPPLQRV